MNVQGISVYASQASKTPISQQNASASSSAIFSLSLATGQNSPIGQTVNSVTASATSSSATDDFMSKVAALGSTIASILSVPIGYAGTSTAFPAPPAPTPIATLPNGDQVFAMVDMTPYNAQIPALAAQGQQEVKNQLDTLFQQNGIPASPPVTFSLDTSGDQIQVKASGDSAQQDKIDQLIAQNPALAAKIQTSISLTQYNQYLTDENEQFAHNMSVLEYNGEGAFYNFSNKAFFDCPTVSTASLAYSSTGLEPLFNNQTATAWENSYNTSLDQLQSNMGYGTYKPYDPSVIQVSQPTGAGVPITQVPWAMAELIASNE